MKQGGRFEPGGGEVTGERKDHNTIPLHDILGFHILPRERVVTADGIIADSDIALEGDLWHEHTHNHTKAHTSRRESQALGLAATAPPMRRAGMGRGGGMTALGRTLGAESPSLEGMLGGGQIVCKRL